MMIGLGLSIPSLVARRRPANQAPPGAPIPTNAPVIAASNGGVHPCTLSITSSAVWTNNPTSKSFQWRKNNVAFGAATAAPQSINTDGPGNWRLTETATNANGSNFSNSNTIAVTEAAATVPAKMAAPVVTAGNNSATVDRADTTASGGSTITRYLIRHSIDAMMVPATTIEQTTDPQVVNGLTNGTLHYFQTAAENAIGQGPWSDTTSVTPLAPATAPAKMSAPTLTAGNSQISGTRAAAPADGGSAITSYDARHSADNGSSWTVVTGIAANFTITGLTNGTAYLVQTRAVNGVGAGAWSDSATATPVAGQVVGYSDDFERADQILEADPRYAVQSGSAGGSVGIVGGQLKTLSNGGANGHVNIVAEQPADFAVEWQIIATGSGMDSFIKVRQSAANNFLGLRVRNGSFQAISTIGGTLTTIASTSAGSAAVVKVEVVGGVGRFFVNGARAGGEINLPAELLDGRIAGYQNRDNTDPAIAEYVRITAISSFSG